MSRAELHLPRPDSCPTPWGHRWENGAILIYKGAKVVVAAGIAIIAAAAAIGGYKAGKRSKDKAKA